MKLFKKIPLWLLSGILYGLSWPIFESLNLSFLAWFAFVPLFVFLEKNQQYFWKSILASCGTMFVFGCVSAGWLFNFPQHKLEITTLFLLEEFWFFIPFFIFFFIQKKIGFDISLWLFPLIWMLWEWTYLELEFTMGTHLSAYSQSNNLWIIQYIDITGMWGVSFWLALFNVLIFKAFKSVRYTLNLQFYKKVGFLAIFMLGIPLVYGGIAYVKYSNLKGNSIRVSLFPTQYSAKYLTNPKNSIAIVEQTLHRTDSIAFTSAEQKIHTDLYLWPETGLPFTMGQSNLSEILSEAVNDWEGALITGVKGVPDTTNENDKRTYVSGVLISHTNKKSVYHHKTVLTPGQEVIPYHSLLAKIQNFPIKETDPRYFKKGKVSKPLELITRNKEKFLVGVSLCYEQWYPKHWVQLAKNGADFYTHLAGEGWYGKMGFMNFMVNVTRMRCIENRRQAARCANVGLSGFIDQMGRFHHFSKNGTLKTTTTKLTAFNEITAYTENPNWFPCLGFIVFLAFFLIQRYSTILCKLLN